MKYLCPTQNLPLLEAFDPFGWKGAFKDTVEGLMDRQHGVVPFLPLKLFFFCFFLGFFGGLSQLGCTKWVNFFNPYSHPLQNDTWETLWVLSWQPKKANSLESLLESGSIPLAKKATIWFLKPYLTLFRGNFGKMQLMNLLWIIQKKTFDATQE